MWTEMASKVFIIAGTIALLGLVAIQQLSVSSSELARKITEQLRVLVMIIFGGFLGFFLAIYETDLMSRSGWEREPLNPTLVKYAAIGAVTGAVVGILLIMAFPTKKQQAK